MTRLDFLGLELLGAEQLCVWINPRNIWGPKTHLGLWVLSLRAWPTWSLDEILDP